MVSVVCSLVTRAEQVVVEVVEQHLGDQSRQICADERIGCQAPFPRRIQAYSDQSRPF